MNPLWLKFAATQLVSLPLMVIGWVLCLDPGTLPWLWCDSTNPKGVEAMTWWQRYRYLGWRNPVCNLKLVKGVATPGGPLLYRTWYWRGKQFYYKIGYMPHEGYPACSAGAGRGY